MKKEGEKLEGRDYDIRFEWSDDKIYCSELIYKIYERAAGIKLGKLQQLKDFDFTNPAVKAQLKERYGHHIPLNETVISPASVFDSELLETIIQK
ncbi:YiiX/YebB-like N1pC/P60 family cysteine hydrolase [Sphingobacterium spiritivorum]